VNVALAPEILAIKARARALVDEHLIPHELELSRNHKLPPAKKAELEQLARDAGLSLLDVPKEFGGQELGLTARVAVWEEFGRTSALPTRGPTILGPEVSPILYKLTGALRDEVLLPVIRGEKRTSFAQTEPGAGSDPGGMQTSAVRDGDEYVINGRKIYIGFVDVADYIQLFAVTDPAKGSHGGISGFIVPVTAPGLRIVRQIETMMRDRPFELAFENVRVPVANRIGEEGQGFAFGQSWLTEGRIRHGARAIGVIERCLELAVARMTSRSTFGAPLASRQTLQWMLVDMQLQLNQLRLMVYTTAAAYDRGEDVRFDAYQCKYFGDESSFAAADRCMQVFGGLGLTTDTPIEAFWRDQRSMIITEGPTEVLKMALARDILKKYSRGG
jgi:acyl-CoA dehydrogenase